MRTAKPNDQQQSPIVGGRRHDWNENLLFPDRRRRQDKVAEADRRRAAVLRKVEIMREAAELGEVLLDPWEDDD